MVVLPPPPPGPPPSTAVRAPMEAPAADAAVRRGLVIATSRRSAGQAEAERRLARCAVVAVVVGSARQFEIVDVKRAVAIKFRIDEEAVKVSLRALGEMLLIFDDAAVRDRVLAGRGPLVLGRISLLVAPWSRFRRASPSKLLYKVRVCLEGVPEHAWDIESVASLFDPSMLIDGIDHEVRREEETGYFRLWCGWTLWRSSRPTECFSWKSRWRRAHPGCISLSSTSLRRCRGAGDSWPCLGIRCSSTLAMSSTSPASRARTVG